MTNSQFGDSDAAARWFGVAPHRVVLTSFAVAVGGDALVRRGAGWWEWVITALAGLSVLPAASSRSWAQVAAVEFRHQVRRRVRWISLEVNDETLSVGDHSERRVWCYEFVHCGRLDLSGRDFTLARRLGRMAESLAASDEDAHLNLRVEASSRDDGVARTVLSLNVASPPPEEWRRDALAGVPRVVRPGRTPLVVRRDYVRTPDFVLRVLRIARFAPGREAFAFEALSENPEWITVSTHVAVISARRARRLTERAVHRIGSDAQVTRGAGFRWSARHERELEAFRQREAAISGGAALCQWAFYLVIRATTLTQLRQRVDQVRDIARGAGIRLDVGTGVQGDWFIWQLPGGPNW